MIIARALYGLNSSGAACRGKSEDNFDSLDYKSSEANDYVWVKQYNKPDSDPYCKYMLWCVYYFLHRGFQPNDDIDLPNLIYQLKGSFGPPGLYLCANFLKLQLDCVCSVWSNNAVDYLKSVIETLIIQLSLINLHLKMMEMGIDHTCPLIDLSFTSLINWVNI